MVKKEKGGKKRRRRKKGRRGEGEGQYDRGGGKTHGDGGSGKEKYRYGCNSFHDFAVGEDDAGILLGDHVEALSRTIVSHIALHTPHQDKGRNIFLRLER